MIQIISGVKGKGKTKFLIQKANEAVKAANGSVVYLDKNNKHMYELSNRIRLINVGDFPIDTYDAFIGFICGIVSQDNDLEEMYLDSFLTIASLSEEQDITKAIEKLGITAVPLPADGPYEYWDVEKQKGKHLYTGMPQVY